MTVSLSGLDLSFLKRKDSAEKGRFRWSDKAGKFVSVREWHRLHGAASKRSRKVGSPFYMGDIKEFVSPVGDDPELIGSRSALREHEKKHNVKQCGDFKPGEITSKNEALKAEREAIAKAHATPAEWAPGKSE